MNTTIKEKFSILNVDLTAEKMYFSAFTLYFVAMFMGTTTYTSYISLHILNYISYISLAVIFFKMVLFDRFSRPQVISYSVVLVVSGLTWLTTNSVLAFAATMFVLGSKGIQFDHIIRWYFNLGVLLLVFTVVSAELGIIQNLTYMRHGNSRQAFGIIYPTDFASHLFYLALAYSYLHFGKLRYKSFIAFLLLSLFSIKFCDARLSAICIFLMIPVLYIAQKAQANQKGVSEKIASVFWVAIPTLVFSVIMASTFYDSSNHIFKKVNNVFSNRVQLSHTGFGRYGFSFLGKPIIEHGWGGSVGLKSYQATGSSFHYFMLDSSIVRIFILYGVTFSLILFLAVSISMMREVKARHYAFVACMFLVIIASVVEQHFLEIVYNPFIIGIVAYTRVNSKKELE